jgi:hypothetical protein
MGDWAERSSTRRVSSGFLWLRCGGLIGRGLGGDVLDGLSVDL